jgi:hemerythrin
MEWFRRADVPVVALDFMNRDHRGHVDQVNVVARLVERARAGEDLSSAIDAAVRGVVQHTREHFAREEDAMRRTGFPPYAIHKAEHDRFLREADAALAHWSQGHDLDALERFLRHVLPGWLVHHVSTMDRVSAEYIGDREPS